ncbi:MAG: type II toxin-antitoxin system HicB family antitoxin [Desulfarculaceae bacterium]|nr:type II toxin-antitoxin system HicB family antitoxin [Desulfarculaceae bacterium]MCF8048731.1 type II toxin-antitoxin system HicB family antitoxin [Desulfarculaceae bacterium]MCF8064010.1 type II toxin-antitoxin system HicB family antitoxin [Desulfarculaceae bacterium]MCF8096271.1 type II toxin-antitoxin system HicB family antitoxin [Desulfarculaceae bacterium]MCF8123461.1 type II toxin-antitoxin system HicB family antitoxin [Desulfarculaceae bacterium]
MNEPQMVFEQDQDGVWVAFCPGLPGCISQGATQQEATANLTEAMEAFRECLERRGESLADCMGREHGS